MLKQQFDIFPILYKERVDYIKQKQKNADPVLKFVLEGELDELAKDSSRAKKATEDNVDKFFSVCQYFRVSRIFIGRGELVGAENVKYGDWPAIWAIARALDNEENSYKYRFTIGCGNGDQYQTSNSHLFLGEEWVDKAWDVKTRTSIDIEPFKMRMVVTRI